MSKNKLFDMKTWFFTLIYWVDDGLNRLKVQIKQYTFWRLENGCQTYGSWAVWGILKIKILKISLVIKLCKNHCGDSGLDYNCGISCFHFFILFICIFSVKKTVVWIMKKKKSMSIKRRKVQREWLNTPDTLSSRTQRTQNQTAYNPGSYS